MLTTQTSRAGVVISPEDSRGSGSTPQTGPSRPVPSRPEFILLLSARSQSSNTSRNQRDRRARSATRRIPVTRRMLAYLLRFINSFATEYKIVNRYRLYISSTTLSRQILLMQEIRSKFPRRILTQRVKILRQNSRNIPLLNIARRVTLVASITTDPYLTLSVCIFFFRVIWTALFNRSADSARARPPLSSYFL